MNVLKMGAGINSASKVKFGILITVRFLSHTLMKGAITIH